MPGTRTLFYQPTAKQVSSAPDTRFRLYLNDKLGLQLRDFHELREWTLDHLNEFWTAVWDYTRVIGKRTDDKVLFDDTQPMDTVNPQLIRANVNYAENMLLSHSYARSSHRALISLIEPKSLSNLDSALTRQLSFEDLYQEVRLVAHTLRTDFNIKPGDTVGAFSPSNAEAVIFCLATLAVGGVWSSCAAEFGSVAVLERLEQIEPKVLLTADSYAYGGKTHQIYPKLKEILSKLPSVRKVVVVGQLYRDRQPREPFPSSGKSEGVEWLSYNEVKKRGQGAEKEIMFHPSNAMDPQWVLYSSGTTGKPKAIVHCHGGMVLSQKMVHTLHNSAQAGDAQMTFTTLGWMMWNHMVGTLGVGCCAVLYDGSPFHPGPQTLWALSSLHKITILGISPRFLQTLETAEYVPNKEYDLRCIEQIQLAGSVLKPGLYDWMRDNVGEQVWVNNGTGGTDICGLFIGAAKSLPIYHGEITVIALGMDLQAWNDDGQPVIDETGDMVICKPFPNQPVGFWGKDGMERYHSAYFEGYPVNDSKRAVWQHGDWIELHSQSKGVMVYGRSDGVLNPAGVRFGSSEIYSVVENVEGVEDCLAVGQRLPDGDERFILFVKPKDASNLAQSVVDSIKSAIRTNLSTRHIPAKIIHLDKLPYTTNGKRLEVPTKKLINGTSWESLNLSSAEDPECLKVFVNHPELTLTSSSSSSPIKAKL